MKLSTRLQGVAESSTLKMNALAKELTSQGHKIVNLTAGEPDFAILEEVKQAAIAAINADFSKYTPVAGIPELRAAISKKFEKDNKLSYTPDQVVVTVGAKQAIFNFLLATISPGGEVITPSPYWVSYPEMVKLAGGKPVIVSTLASAQFKMSPQQLRKALSPKTQALILNSPSNPTGIVYTATEMRALAQVLEGTNVWVVSDEIYEKLVYDHGFCSFGSLSNDAFRRTLTVNGFSKSYAMTGWRLGYAAGPKELISAMTLIQGQSTSGASSIVQKAGVKALTLPESVFPPMVAAFKRRRDKMVEIFRHCKHISFVIPQGAFYLFINLEALKGKSYASGEGIKILKNSEDYAFYLLDKAQVVTVPGGGFGEDHYLRLSFAVADSLVEQGAKKIVEAIEKLA